LLRSRRARFSALASTRAHASGKKLAAKGALEPSYMARTFGRAATLLRKALSCG
jgi:hypothetical protein